MSSVTPQDGVSFTLFFKDRQDQPVRCVMSEGSPWFEAAPICELLKLPLITIQGFDATALDSDIAQHAFDDEPTAVVSPIGVWKLSLHAGRPQGPNVASWAKREAARLIPDQDPNDPRLHLTLNPDGSRPPYPDKYSGRRAEWGDLLFLPGYKTDRQIAGERYSASLHETDTVAVTAQAGYPVIAAPHRLISQPVQPRPQQSSN